MTKTKEDKPVSPYIRLLAVQKEISAIPREMTNIHFSSKYFTINHCLQLVKPVLNKYGFILTQNDGFMINNDEIIPILKTDIIDTEDGTTVLSSTTPMPKETNPQKKGSINTYMRRYALVSLLALEGEDDDDGNAASLPTASKPPVKVKTTAAF